MQSASSTLQRVSAESVRKSLLSLGFALLIGLGAQVKVFLPFTPVPVTFQTLFLLIGAFYLRRGFSLQMVAWYLLLGIVGLPFFAGEAKGISYLWGPTGGYLIGFFLAAALLGFYRPEGRFFQLLNFFAAHAVIFFPGLLWLHTTTHTPWSQTLQMGLYPFLLGDLLKTSIAFTGSLFFPRGR